jgi:hypothetical protein
MSGHGFHVHGPHDHELEHAAQGGHDSGGMIAQIAVVTAIIATVGALFSYMGGATQANAGLYKNNAAIKKTEASNQWNFFQAKSTKQSLAEFARDLAPDDKKVAYQGKIDRYEKEKNEIKVGAEKLLGASHHGAAGLDCPGGHCPADAQEVAGARHVRAGRCRPRAGRSGFATYLIATRARIYCASALKHLKPLKGNLQWPMALARLQDARRGKHRL